MTKPIELTASQRVGMVESVSPMRITVRLAQDSPQGTALNAGSVQRFPRINSWVLIPSEIGYLVGTVTWIGYEQARVVGRDPGSSDLVDLPDSSRRMHVLPLGTLRSIGGEASKAELVRGIVGYPSVGDPILVPTASQAAALAEVDEYARVGIGTAPLAGDIDVYVDPDKLFGRHLAVLGNTGSGKSCTVAGLIRWSIEAAHKDGAEGFEAPDARFVILDPNGEYTSAFDGLPNTRIVRLAVEPAEEEILFTVPGWMWSSEEWASVLSARPGVQRPALNEALGNLRGAQQSVAADQAALHRLLRGYHARFQAAWNAGLSGFTGWPANNDMGSLLENIAEDFRTANAGSFAGDLSSVAAAAAAAAGRRRWVSKTGSTGYNDFSETDLRPVANAFSELMQHVPEVTTGSGSVNIDAPHRFNEQELPDHLQFLAGDPRFAGSAQHVAPMMLRLETMLNDERIRPIVAPADSPELADWISDYLGDGSTSANITVVDLSLMPSDVLHTSVSVIARLLFEVLQRYRKTQGDALPTVLVLEEAHSFVARGAVDPDMPAPRHMCRTVFERIAREGRKFGLSLVLSSQRPSELSPTILAQCNSFVLHRLVNDVDQELVRKLVPDTLGDLLVELPALPSRRALLVGWATALPTLVTIKELGEAHRPRSEDPRFWDVWTRRRQLPRDWSALSEEWLS